MNTSDARTSASARKLAAEEREDLMIEKCPARFGNFDTWNASVPPMYSFPWRYWNMGPAERELTWLLDQNRIDDAVVYWVHEIDCLLTAPFIERMPDAERTALIERLREMGRIAFMPGGWTRWYMLGPKSGIDQILRDVAFLSAPRNPEYVRHMSWQAGDATTERGTNYTR